MGQYKYYRKTDVKPEFQGEEYLVMARVYEGMGYGGNSWDVQAVGSLEESLEEVESHGRGDFRQLQDPKMIVEGVGNIRNLIRDCFSIRQDGRLVNSNILKRILRE